MKNLPIQNSISIKLLKIVFLVYLGVTMVTLSIHLYTQFDSTKKQINIEIQSVEDKFKESLSAAMWNFSVEEINSILKGINNNQLVSGVKLLDNNNIVVNEKGNVNGDNYLQDTFTIDRTYKGKDYLLGKVEIYSDPNIVFEKFQENIHFIAKNTLIVAFVLSVVLVILFYKYLTKPLNQLTQSLEGLNLENLKECKLLQEEYNIDKKHADELELFKASFIEMASKIVSSTEELNQLNKTLEKKVIQRTKSLEEANEQLKELSQIDGLTKVHNRRYLDQNLELIWRAHQRNQTPISLMILDIDFFKKYNDTYGHVEGDECLCKVATALQRTLKRPTDLLARYGGEEFCVVVQGDQEEALFIAELLRKEVASLNIEHKASNKGIVSISIGINSTIPSEKSSITSLLRNADTALYVSKGHGRDQINVYE